MELLDRYVKAVALWLPRAQAPDIAREIAADLQAEIEEQEASLGRSLSPAETEAILTRWGHPMLVASRYQPQESLIGPALLPTYRFVLKLIGLVYCLPWLLVWIGLALFDAGWRADHPDVIASLRPLFFTVLFLFALVTVAFAVVESRHRRNRTLERWTARELAASGSRPDWRHIPRLGSVIEMAVTVTALSWWIGLAGSPATWVLGDAIHVTLAPFQSGYFWTVLLLMIGDVFLSAANLVRPRWTRGRLAVQAGLDAVGLIVVALLLPTTILQVAPSAREALNAVELARWVNLGWTISLAVAGAILVGRLALSLARLGRVGVAVSAAAAPVALWLAMTGAIPPDVRGASAAAAVRTATAAGSARADRPAVPAAPPAAESPRASAPAL
jgi:hypothetical protein